MTSVGNSNNDFELFSSCILANASTKAGKSNSKKVIFLDFKTRYWMV